MSRLGRFVLGTLMPRNERTPGVLDTDLDGFWRQFQSEAPWLMRVGFFLACCFFVLTPVFTVYLPLPAFVLPKGLLGRHTRRLSSSSIYHVRQLMFFLKLVGGLCWGQDASVRKALGVDSLPPDPATWRPAS